MAEVFQRHLIQEMKWRDRGIKPRKGLYLLRESTMNAVMTENGFMTHPWQATKLMRNSTRKNVAMAHVQAIVEIETRK